MSLQKRNEAIIQTIMDTVTALKANKCREDIAYLEIELLYTPWWKFRTKRRLKRMIASLHAKKVIIAVMGAVQIAQIVMQPIPKNKPGIDDQLPRVYPIFVPPLGDLPGEEPIPYPDGE